MSRAAGLTAEAEGPKVYAVSVAPWPSLWHVLPDGGKRALCGWKLPFERDWRYLNRSYRPGDLEVADESMMPLGRLAFCRRCFTNGGDVRFPRGRRSQ